MNNFYYMTEAVVDLLEPICDAETDENGNCLIPWYND